MNTLSDALQQMIEQAVETGVRKALDQKSTRGRRLVSVRHAAEYLSLSKREIYNMIANGELTAVRRGRRILLELDELDRWIDRQKG